MISFSTVKLFGYGVLLVAGISVGYGLADTIKVKPLKAKVAQLEAEKSVLLEAYTSQRVATVELQEVVNSQNITCTARLSKKDSLIADLRKLCVLQSGGPYANPSHDVTLDLLNGLFPDEGGSRQN